MDDLEHFWSKISGFSTSLGPSEGSRRPNRAAVTPIGQQNQPGQLKLLVLHEKTGKNTEFDFAPTKTRFFSGTLCNLVRRRARARSIYIVASWDTRKITI